MGKPSGMFGNHHSSMVRKVARLLVLQVQRLAWRLGPMKPWWGARDLSHLRQTRYALDKVELPGGETQLPPLLLWSHSMPTNRVEEFLTGLCERRGLTPSASGLSASSIGKRCEGPASARPAAKAGERQGATWGGSSRDGHRSSL